MGFLKDKMYLRKLRPKEELKEAIVMKKTYPMQATGPFVTGLLNGNIDANKSDFSKQRTIGAMFQLILHDLF